jgi:hypothetical protein
MVWVNGSESILGAPNPRRSMGHDKGREMHRISKGFLQLISSSSAIDKGFMAHS